jgi:2-hydroxychromene-2-carboxylate isomerase
MTAIQFYFDYYSPYAYLANALLQRQKFEIDYRPVSLPELMDRVNNQLTPKSPAKFAYVQRDVARCAQRHSVPLNVNAPYWVALQAGALNSRLFILGALAAQQLGYFPAYHSAVFDALWGRPRDVVSREGRISLVQELNIPAEQLWSLAESEKIANKLVQLTTDAASAGIFGAPIFVVHGEMYFGADRLDWAIEHANRSSVSAAISI